MKGLQTALQVSLLIASVWTATAFIHIKPDKYDALVKWIEENGGSVKASLGINQMGTHGIFATEFIKAGDPIAQIPSSTILDVGTFETGQVLREILSSQSKYKPYLDIMPGKSELVHGCNLSPELAPMLQSEFWEALVWNWQQYMKSQTFTRVFHDGAAMLLIPIFDLANHRRNCTTNVVADKSKKGQKLFVAGEDLGPGDEICFGFKSHLRDDYAFINFGVVAEEEHPPRLFLVDHHLFDFRDEGASVKNQVFNGTEEEVKSELLRLHTLDKFLKDAGVAPDKEDAGLVYNMLRTLQIRRRAGVTYEIKRLAQLHSHWLDVVQLLEGFLAPEEGGDKHPEL
eukprot:gene20584-27381_t